MTRKLLVAAVVLLALALGWVLWLWQPDAGRAGIPVVPAGGDFRLQSADGPVSLSDLRGKVVLVYFGYTFCPDICPTSLAFAAQALNSLGREELARTRIMFVSVDPERDTPAKLKEYAAFFHPNMIAVSGDAADVAEVARRYGAGYARQETGSSGGYVVDHTSATYVVDPRGKLVATLAHGTPPGEVAKAIRAALNS